jgi:hypothetical protein
MMASSSSSTAGQAVDAKVDDKPADDDDEEGEGEGADNN